MVYIGGVVGEVNAMGIVSVVRCIWCSFGVVSVLMDLLTLSLLEGSVSPHSNMIL